MARKQLLQAGIIAAATGFASVTAVSGWANSQTTITAEKFRMLMESGDYEDRNGVIPFLVGEWGKNCEVQDRLKFTDNSMESESAKGSIMVASVGRSTRSGEFGMIYLPIDGANPNSWVAVFQILNENEIRILESIRDGEPEGILGTRMTLKRCT